MQEICCKLGRLGAVVVLFLAVSVGSAWAQNAGIPWQVNDVVACVAPDTCYVLRIHSDNSIQFLDSLSDGLNNNGQASGVAINNTLHLLTTNDAGTTSKVVEYSIASVNPFDGSIPNPVHAPVGTFSTAGKNATAIAINKFGHIFVGNADTGNSASPSIVELNAAGSPVSGSTFTFTGDCAIAAPSVLNSLDLSGDGSLIYVTAGDGVIRKVSLVPTGNTWTLNNGTSSATCQKFADFGTGVHLYGIKDIPQHALPTTCRSSVTPSTNCPTDETILVVATGTIDPDAQESEETESSSDAVDICTNAVDTATASCALLLNVNGTGLTANRWIANNPYPNPGDTILDPYLHIRTVFTTGKSGSDEPNWTAAGGLVRDNAVVWSDQGNKPWQAGQTYTKDTIVVDSGFHAQKVLVGGKSGSSSTFSDNPVGGGLKTPDNAVTWTNSGGPTIWSAETQYTVGQFILDFDNHVQEVNSVTPPGTPGANEPGPCTNEPCGGTSNQWSDTGGTTTDGNVIWIDRGPKAWQPTHVYNQNDAVFDGTNIEQVTTAGTSADTSPVNVAGWQPITTIDGLTWFDKGGWQPDHQYHAGDVVGDPAHDLQQVCDNSTSGCPSTGGDGISGHTQPSWNDTGGLTTDGLQWSDQTNPAPAIVVRYPVTGTNTLQSLALDPLVRDCISNPCANSISATNYRKTSNFWMADSAHPTVYKLDFTTGAITPPSTGFDVSNCTFYTNTGTTNPCSGVTGITGFGVYGSESASQPGLASLVSNLQLGSLQAPNFTASATILQNTITSTLYSNNTSPPALTNISLYASIVDQSSCFNDPSVGSIPCTITVPNSSNAVVWKLDVPLGGSATVPSAALPKSETLNSAFVAPGTTNSTDVFVDEQFDDTTFVGSDPGTRTVSVHSLHEVQTTLNQGQSQCQFSSPLAGQCYKLNRSTLNFTFSCPVLTPTQLASLKPVVLSLVKKTIGLAPQFIAVTGNTATNGKPAFRLDATHNIYTYQLNLSGFAPGTYLGTAFDGVTNVVPSFTTGNFMLSNTCK